MAVPYSFCAAEVPLLRQQAGEAKLLRILGRMKFGNAPEAFNNFATDAITS